MYKRQVYTHFQYLSANTSHSFFAVITAATPLSLLETSETVSLASPVVCPFDSFHDGIQCRAERRQLLSEGKTRPLELIIPPRADDLSLSGWVYLSSPLPSNGSPVVSLLSQDKATYFSFGVNHADSTITLQTSAASCLDTSSPLTLSQS